MANPDDSISGTVAASLIALGVGVLVGMAIGSGASDRRASFSARLRGNLAHRGLEFVSAELGSGAVWLVTLRLPGGYQTFQVPLAPGSDPLADATCDEMSDRIAVFVHGNLLAAKAG